MTTIKQWLADRRRKYADGLALFNKYASPELKSKFGAYFNEVDSCPAFDGHMTTLVNKLTVIDRDANLSQVSTATPTAGVISSGTMKPKASGKAAGNPPDNKTPGAKIKLADLPDELQGLVKRVREITPLYAAAFTEMASESIADKDRAEVAKEVFNLWCERRAIWEQLDAHAKSKDAILDVGFAKPEPLPTNPLLDGMFLAKKIERLKEKIARTEKAITMHSENGKENLRVAALQRLEKFNMELADLMAKIPQA